MKRYIEMLKTQMEKISSWIKENDHLINFISAICSIIALILSFFVFCNIGNISEWQEHVKTQENSSAAVNEWKEELSNLRVGYSRQYIEEILGIPQLTEAMTVDLNSYSKTTYI